MAISKKDYKKDKVNIKEKRKEYKNDLNVEIIAVSKIRNIIEPMKSELEKIDDDLIDAELILKKRKRKK